MDIQIKKGKSNIEIDVDDFYTEEVTKFGNSAKINCKKKYIGKKVMVLVLEE